MKLITLDQVDNFKNKRVLVRVDFNVPMKGKKILDESRLVESLPTIKYLLKQKAKVILVSHLGHPNGVGKKLSLLPIKNRLEELIKKNIKILNIKYLKDDRKMYEGYFASASKEIEKMGSGNILILENVRYFKEEELNSDEFAQSLALIADIFVLDGFAVAHRDSASVSGVAKYLPSYAGLLLEKEITELDKLLNNPAHPFVAVIGGVKVETKLPVIKNLLPHVGHVLIGGGLVNTYLKAKGYQVGSSLVDDKFLKQAKKILSNKKIIKPVDVVVGTSDGKKFKIMKIGWGFKVQDMSYGIYDIGPETIRLYAKYIKQAQTLVWNGAMGFFEQKPYNVGTHAIARLVATRSKGKAYGVIGGGETIQSMEQVKMKEYVDFISTGGGAMLEYLSGNNLPGLKALLI